MTADASAGGQRGPPSQGAALAEELDGLRAALAESERVAAETLAAGESAIKYKSPLNAARSKTHTIIAVIGRVQMSIVTK